MKEIMKLLIVSDFLIYFGIGLTSNILSIFIKDNLIGGTIMFAGLAAATFLIIKSILQIIFSKIFKREQRFKMVLWGSLLISLTPILYALSTNVWHMLLAQCVYGIAAGLTSPAWMNLFILNIDKKRPGFEWSIYSAILGIGIAIAAYLGAWLVQILGFKAVFILSGLFGIAGTLLLFAKLNKNRMKIK